MDILERLVDAVTSNEQLFPLVLLAALVAWAIFLMASKLK